MADGSLSQFKATLARKKARKDKRQGKFERKKLGNKSTNQEYNFPQVSESELKIIKDGIRRKIKSQTKIEYVILLILLVSAFLVMIYINIPED